VLCGPRWRTSCMCVVKELSLTALTLLAVITAAFGRTISREISLSDEIISRSREITLPDNIRTRCAPVPHEALWLRLNIVPRLPTNADVVLANGLQGASDRVRTSTDQQPETDIDFRSHDGRSRRRRYRRDALEGRQRRRRRRKQQRQQQRQQRDKKQHRQRNSRRRELFTQLSDTDGEPWHCHMTSHWLRMPDDVFPPYIETGSCTQSHCMRGLYECRARKYATRILRRLPDRCNPLPVADDVTVGAGFEEAWAAEEYHVIVGCECSKRRSSGWYDEVRHSL